MERYREDAISNIESWGIVVNSFDGGGPSSVSADEVLTWLDSCPGGSVVHVCFRSHAVLNQRQMDELAAGLERSGVRFILCTKQSSRGGHVAAGDVRAVPEDFEARVARRGLMIRGWAPQVAILRHRAVGTFLTHYGWNSMLEGLSAGAVMLTWPMGVEQFVNAKLLVDELGVGIRVGEGSEKILEAAELAFDQVIEGQSTPKDAINGGSSNNDLSDFMRCMDRQRRSKIQTF
ncbi:hypothetical protein ACJRO7_009844 [Eucalyptus globulus]|uniref:Uncharacterized protein n=1 Tax=Eucalyptus globulus TaxID=34317 RepID=A0ABD3LFK5_EUCGL